MDSPVRILKYALLFLLVAVPCWAAMFKSVEELDEDSRGVLWNYVFTIKSSSLAISTPLLITKTACWYKKGAEAIPLNDVKPCYKTEPLARVAAQEEADKFEKDLTLKGLSTSKIEAARLYRKVVK